LLYNQEIPMFQHSFAVFLKRFGLVLLSLSALLCLTARAQNFADSGFVAETVATLPPYKPGRRTASCES